MCGSWLNYEHSLLTLIRKRVVSGMAGFWFWFFTCCALISTFVSSDFDFPAQNVTGDELDLPVGRFSLVVVPVNRTLKVFVPLSPSISVLVVQAHATDAVLTASLTEDFSQGNVYQGASVGMVLKPAVLSQVTSWYLRADRATQALVAALSYSAEAPVPGGCNLEFNLETDPNLHIAFKDVVELEFAPANIGWPWFVAEPPCDVGTGAGTRWRLEYDLFCWVLPTSFKNSVEWYQFARMAMPGSTLRFGSKVTTLPSTSLPRVLITTAPRLSIIFALVVHDPLTRTSASYVPILVPGCTTCGDGVLVILLCVSIGTLGLILCFLGHYLYRVETFLSAFAVTASLTTVLIIRFTEFTDYAALAMGLGAAMLAGCIALLVWWRFGSVLLCSLILSLLLGAQVALIIFATPIGNLAVFKSDFNFWMCFVSVVLLGPLLSLPCLKLSAVVACSVIGAEMVVLAIAWFVPCALPYLLIIVPRRAAHPSTALAINSLPLQPYDLLFMALWLLLAMSGTVIQCQLLCDRPPFPPCPYDHWREERERRRDDLLNPRHHRQARRSCPQPGGCGERTPLLLAH
uniref:transmembrane 7 superfamily member 3-like isoform X1 n=2 Tax=Myxine glutinosa TaxID=7769 RepID=UPI00358E1C9D